MDDKQIHHSSCQKNKFQTLFPVNVSFRYKVVSLLAVILVCCFIFYASSLPGYDLEDGSGILGALKNFLSQFLVSIFHQPADVSVIGHFCEFALLSVTFVNLFHCYSSELKTFFLSILCTSLYGITDELHQLFIPLRTCDPFDWFVDTLAAVFAAGVSLLILRVKVKHSMNKRMKPN